MKKLACILIVILCIPFLFSCAPSNTEPIATITPKTLTEWRVWDNSAKEDVNYKKIKDEYNGKYVKITHCEVYSIGSKHIIVDDSNYRLSQNLFVYVNKDQISKLQNLSTGDIVKVKGKVKAKQGFLSRDFIITNAIIY